MDKFEEKQPDKYTGNKWVLYIIIGVICYAAYQYFNSESLTKNSDSQSETGTNISNGPVVVNVNDTLKTNYFDIVASNVKVKSKISPGWPYDNILAGKDEIFVMFKASYKNIDNESRMVEEGELMINYNGKDYKFDHPEVLDVPGYGLFLDQINPLITKRTTLVYKLPSYIKGDIYWHPGRSADNKIIGLGHL